MKDFILRFVMSFIQAFLATADPEMLKALGENLNEFVDLFKQVFGGDGRKVQTMATVEASGLLNGKGAIGDLIKWFITNPEALKALLDFLKLIGVLKAENA